jgi:hypothetical protein
MTNVTDKFLSMYLFLFLTLYMFRAHRAHHQERQIVPIHPLVTVALCWWPCRVQVGRENKYIERNLCSRWSFTKNHYVMHGQQKLKILILVILLAFGSEIIFIFKIWSCIFYLFWHLFSAATWQWLHNSYSETAIDRTFVEFRFHFWQEHEISLFSRESRPILVLTHPVLFNG